jgi:hypothetical protein
MTFMGMDCCMPHAAATEVGSFRPSVARSSASAKIGDSSSGQPIVSLASARLQAPAGGLARVEAG